MRLICRLLGGILVLAVSCHVMAAPIRVSLDFFANPNHVPLYVALEKGFFEDEGVSIDIFVPANPSDPVKLAAARAVEIALTPQINYLIARSEGLPLIAIGALIDRPLGGLVALRDEGVGILDDLAGKRIGYALEPLEPILWETVLQCAGIDAADVNLINVGFNTITALLAGHVDAVGAFCNYEVLQLEELGVEPIFFPQEDFCVPTTYEIILVTHPNFLKDRTTEAEGFLRALARAIEWTTDYPADALGIFFGRFPELDDPLNRRSFDVTVPLFARGAFHADETVWAEMQQFLLANELMTKAFELDELYTDGVLPQMGEE